MSLISAMYTGQSGMECNSTDLAVIGDNIANANTIGFKGSRAAFEDALAQSLVGGSQLGWGAKLEAIQRLVTQGALTNTGLATDLAIQGNGFFVVKGHQNGVDGSYYTRAGQFTVDKDGNLVNLDGLQVQGYQADSSGAITANVGNLMVGTATSAPGATANVSMKANLNSASVTPALPWDPTNPAGTSNYNTSVTVYDSLGTSHPVNVYFRNNGAGGWEWHAMADGGGLTGGTAGTPTEIASGTLTFDVTGKLTAQTQTTNFNPLGATNPQPVTWNFGTPTGTGGTGVDGITQYTNPSATSFTSQDGFTAGDLSRINIDSTGVITGTFSNGQNRALGQVVVAQFAAADQLERMGSNVFSVRPGSGAPTIGAAGAGGRGAIVAGVLEQSNVDIATEFVRMIAAQRGYQANSRTISTADQLLQELMALKR